MAIDENYLTEYEKVATHDGENQPIQIWAKDQDSYSGIGSDKLGVWGTIVGVDFDLCIADLSRSITFVSSSTDIIKEDNTFLRPAELVLRI